MNSICLMVSANRLLTAKAERGFVTETVRLLNVRGVAVQTGAEHASILS